MLSNNQNDELIDTDEIFNQLENEDVPAHIREARLNELVLNSFENKFKQKNSNQLYADLNGDDFLKLTTNEKKCIVHFYHPGFKTCEKMDSHLQKIASKNNEIRFARVNALKAKFFVDKLKIQTLPAVLCFVDGIVKDRIIGFDELGATDNFSTHVLEKRLMRKGILRNDVRDDEDDANESDTEDKQRRTKFRSTMRKENDESDSD